MSEPQPALEIEDSNAGCRTLPLEKEITRLGRSGDNDVQFLETHVSKRHADIVRRGGRYVVVDTGSKAGVFVNGERVTEQPLADGDLITLGQTPIPSLVFRSTNGAAVARHPVARPPAASLLTTFTVRTGEHRLENLAKFLEFSRLLGGRVSLNDALESVVDLAIELTGAERGFLILSETGGGLDYRVARGQDGLSIPPEEVRVSETIVHEVLQTGTTRVVSDIQGEQDLADLKSVVLLGLGSAVALPLRGSTHTEGTVAATEMDGQVFGVLYLDSRKAASGLTRMDQGILETVARDASSVIENARLYREAEEKRRLEAEMDLAREVQAALLPQTFWSAPHFELAGSCVPSRHLGGDYLDQFRIGSDSCGLVVADVSGKGMPAALLAAALQGAMAAESATEQPLGALVERVNRAICRLAPTGKFITFVCAVLSPSGDLTYVNAGHPPPIVITSNGQAQQLFTGDMALGIRDTNRYHEKTIRLRADDVVALYTDGATEAEAPDGAMFDESRLETILRASCRLPAGDILKSIIEGVDSFTCHAPPRDDITLLILKLLRHA